MFDNYDILCNRFYIMNKYIEHKIFDCLWRERLKINNCGV